MPPEAPGPVAVGKITAAHGIRGEVSVLVLTEVEARFDAGASVALEDGRTLSVEASRPHRKGGLVKFAEVTDRTQAELLRGAYLFVAEADLPDLPEGSWWPHQLEGCEVVTQGGRSLGNIREVVLAPANDIWVAGPPEREVLIPAIRDVVVEVDLQARRVIVREIPGLTSAPEAGPSPQ